MSCESYKQGNAVVLKLKGRLDTVSAPELEKECARWVDAGELLLVVDLAELEYISSAGLRVFLATAKKLKPHQGEIRFCSLRNMVQEVFTISGFSTMFALYDSLDTALSGR